MLLFILMLWSEEVQCGTNWLLLLSFLFPQLVIFHLLTVGSWPSLPCGTFCYCCHEKCKEGGDWQWTAVTWHVSWSNRRSSGEFIFYFSFFIFWLVRSRCKAHAKQASRTQNSLAHSLARWTLHLPLYFSFCL